MSDYTTVDYELLNKYILDYQSGVKGSAEKILDSFNGFILKYVKLICEGKFDIDDLGLRNFIRLYCDNDVKRFVHSYKHRASIRIRIYETVSKIQYLYSRYSVLDIQHECIGCILTMAKKYKDYTKPSFHNYVDKCFNLYLCKVLSTKSFDIGKMNYEEYNDSILVCTDSLYEYDTRLEYADAYYRINNTDKLLLSTPKSPFTKEFLNINWINGITCNEVFNVLTPFERNILIMYYINEMDDKSIADSLGFCRATINRKRLRAIKMLESSLTNRR